MDIISKKVSNIDISISERNLSFSIILVLLEITNIFVSVVSYKWPLSMHLTIKVISFIGSNCTAWCVYDFSFSVVQSILETSFVLKTTFIS